MSKINFKIEPERAKAIGRLLFQKYDISKRGVLQPKQCFEVFSDFCYRILSIDKPPTMEEAQSMHKILDLNQDSRVTEADFQNLALRYLCPQNYSSNRYETRTTTTITIQKTSNSSTHKNYTGLAKRRLDVARRLFKMFDTDQSGFLTEQEIPKMLIETYKQMGQLNYNPTNDDVKSYMRMVDKNSDGRVSMDEFQQIVLLSLQKAGFEIYE